MPDGISSARAFSPAGADRDRQASAEPLVTRRSTSSFQHENAILLDACRIGPPARPAPAASCNWDYLLRAATYQGVAPLLHEWGGHASPGPPPEIASRLYHHYWATHFRNRALLAELEAIAEAAAAAGVDVVPLKGADLAARVYPSPALRPMSDVDLLVRAEHLDRMRDVLQSRGYEDFSMSMSYVDDQRLDRGSFEHRWQGSRDGVHILVEFRAEPMEPSVCRLADLDPALSLALREHTAAMWSRRVATPAGPRLSAGDLFLHVATHLAAKHGEFRLIWLHDLARTAASPAPLDWAALGAAAGRLQVSGPVYAAMQAAARLMAAPIGDAALEQFQRAAQPHAHGLLRNWEQQTLAREAERLRTADLTQEGPALSRLVTGLGRLRGWRSRLRALRWVALPSRAYLDRWPDYRSAPRAFGYAGAWFRRYRGAVARRLRRRPLP
jgi:hypothetical protein